jgi:hypothetical protein
MHRLERAQIGEYRLQVIVGQVANQPPGHEPVQRARANGPEAVMETSLLAGMGRAVSGRKNPEINHRARSGESVELDRGKASNQ